LLTAADAPLGDVGKFSNEDIATAVEWEGEPDDLVNALVETDWLDRSDEFRLVVHHWHEHVPNYLKQRIQRRVEKGGEWFVTEQNAELTPANASAARIGGHRRTSADSGGQRLPTEPSQAEPEPSLAEPARARRIPVRGRDNPGEQAPPGGSGSGSQKSPLSDSGTSGEARRQIENLSLRSTVERIAKLLRVPAPESHPEESRRRKQAVADLVTISKAVEHCRGDPTALETVERLAGEVAAGKLIKKPVAAWVQRVKDAGLFYK